MIRIALAVLALLLLACTPPADRPSSGPATPAVERSAPRHPSAPARQKPARVPRQSKESLQAGEYYRYVDEFGRVRLAASLDEVPERQRSTAGRVSAPTRLQQMAEADPEPASISSTETFDGNVVLYTTKSCPWCQKATKYLDSIGQDYVNWDVSNDPEKALEYMKLTNGRQGVPVIVVGNKWMQGWNQEQFDRMLQAAASN